MLRLQGPWVNVWTSYSPPEEGHSSRFKWGVWLLQYGTFKGWQALWVLGPVHRPSGHLKSEGKFWCRKQTAAGPSLTHLALRARANVPCVGPHRGAGLWKLHQCLKQQGCKVIDISCHIAKKKKVMVTMVTTLAIQGQDPCEGKNRARWDAPRTRFNLFRKIKEHNIFYISLITTSYLS